MSEQRRQPRRQLKRSRKAIAATVELGEELIRGKVVRLSKGGLFVCIDASPDSGEPVVLQLDHDGASVEVVGTVARVESSGLFVAIDDPSEEYRALFEAVLTQ